MKKELLLSALAGICFLGACGTSGEKEPQSTAEPVINTPAAETAQPSAEPAHARLTYLGHASVRIVTAEEKVIYIDPYAGEGYDLPADLILITHDHYDHNAPEKISETNPDCRTITWSDSLAGGSHQSFDLGYAAVRSTQAGNNPNHSITECVGYILTLSDGTVLYFSGDTSETEEMASLSEEHIDYAFLCCDGVYNMDLEEAGHCADLIQAAHTIPYHMVTPDTGLFDAARAASFPSDTLLVLKDGQEIELLHR